MGEETTKVGGTTSSKFFKAIVAAARRLFFATVERPERTRAYEEARDYTLFVWSEDVEERLAKLEAKAEVVPQRTLDDL